MQLVACNPAEETDLGNHLVPMNVASLGGTCTKLTISEVATPDLKGGVTCNQS
jgi:hypothetical protein